jgi:predicted Fe-S protein YdhL (DUF1289 family)
MTAIPTPCVNICRIDRASRLCEGCGRTLEEIARWRVLTDAERLAVMTELSERMGRAGLKPAQPASERS